MKPVGKLATDGSSHPGVGAESQVGMPPGIRSRGLRLAHSPRVSVVIPALNEAKNLEHVLTALPEGIFEVVVVDGGSTDGTLEVARRLRSDVRAIRQTRRGKGNALACGFAACSGDVIVMLDADGSADPAEIPRFVDALVAGADYAKGSRFIRGGGSADITRFRRAGIAFSCCWSTPCLERSTATCATATTRSGQATAFPSSTSTGDHALRRKVTGACGATVSRSRR